METPPPSTTTRSGGIEYRVSSSGSALDRARAAKAQPAAQPNPYEPNPFFGGAFDSAFDSAFDVEEDDPRLRL